MNEESHVSYNTSEGCIVSIVFPCLNEEPCILQCIQAAQKALDSMKITYEIVVVDNNCTDRTAEIAREAGARIVKETTPGYGAALRKGIESARGQVVIMADADGTYELPKIPEFVAPILEGRCDVVMGNRFADIKRGAMPTLHRYLGNPVLSWMVRLMFRTRVRDVHCGMRAFSSEAYRSLGLVTTGMEFASEMIIRSVYHRLRIGEVDISYHPRLGESKLRTLHDGWRHLRLMLIYSPDIVFILPAIIFWVLGAVVMAALYPGPLQIGARWYDIHSMLAAATANLVGLQLAAMGIVAKAYGHYSGLRRDRFIERWSGRSNLEHGILVSAILALLAMGFIGYTVWTWAQGGFGNLMHTRELLIGLVLICNAVVVSASSFILSLMVIPHSNERQPYPGGLRSSSDSND